MTGYGAATAEVVAKLDAAGIPATADAASLQAPGVWVTPAAIDFALMDGSEYFASWELYLVSPDLDAVSALDHLTDLAGMIRGVFPQDVTEFRAVTLNLPNIAADGVPALTTTLELKVT